MLVGLLAGSLTTVSFVPQLLRTWRLRSARDLSYPMLVIFASGVSLWLLYGLLLGSLPIILANVATLGLVLAILALKLRYG